MHLFPEHVPHGGVDGPRPLPGPRQLVLRRRPLVAVQGAHHVARPEQGTAAVGKYCSWVGSERDRLETNWQLCYKIRYDSSKFNYDYKLYILEVITYNGKGLSLQTIHFI